MGIILLRLHIKNQLFYNFLIIKSESKIFFKLYS